MRTMELDEPRTERTQGTKTNIGRWVCLKVTKHGYGQRVYGTVMDLVAGTDRPKRIRIQRGDPSLAGEVVQPGEYEFCWFADEEED